MCNYSWESGYVFPNVFKCFVSILLCSFQCNLYVLYNLRKPNSFLENADKQLMRYVSFYRIVGLRAHGRLCFFCKVHELYYSWFSCKAVISEASGLVVMNEISVAARSLPTNLLPAVCGIIK